jgi:hypothetical protein
MSKPLRTQHADLSDAERDSALAGFVQRARPPPPDKEASGAADAAADDNSAAGVFLHVHRLKFACAHSPQVVPQACCSGGLFGGAACGSSIAIRLQEHIHQHASCWRPSARHRCETLNPAAGPAVSAHVLAVSDVGLRALEGRGAPPPPPLFVHYDLPVRKVRVSLDWLPSSRAGWVQSAFKVPQTLLWTAVWPPALKTPRGIDATHALCRGP